MVEVLLVPKQGDKKPIVMNIGRQPVSTVTVEENGGAN
jgi:hypothetical protein